MKPEEDESGGRQEHEDDTGEIKKRLRMVEYQIFLLTSQVEYLEHLANRFHGSEINDD